MSLTIYHVFNLPSFIHPCQRTLHLNESHNISHIYFEWVVQSATYEFLMSLNYEWDLQCDSFPVTRQWVMSRRIWVCHDTHINESRYTFLQYDSFPVTCFNFEKNEFYNMSHITYERVLQYVTYSLMTHSHVWHGT